MKKLPYLLIAPHRLSQQHTDLSIQIHNTQPKGGVLLWKKPLTTNHLPRAISPSRGPAKLLAD